jgi:hypothetical protein
MRALPLSFLVALSLASAARAEPAQEARSAMGACLSAIMEGAPVEYIDGDDVSIRRGKDPVSCSVEVRGGEPVVIRDAIQQALDKRSEKMLPAKSKWDPEGYASRETFCNLPGRRNFLATVSTAKPGRVPVLVATVVELPKRDSRCDRDEGLQKLPPKADAKP